MKCRECGTQWTDCPHMPRSEVVRAESRAFWWWLLGGLVVGVLVAAGVEWLK